MSGTSKRIREGKQSVFNFSISFFAITEYNTAKGDDWLLDFAKLQ